MSLNQPDATPQTIQKWITDRFDKLLNQNHVATMKRCDVVYLSSHGKGAGRYIVNVLNKTYTVELDTRLVVELTTGRPAGEKLAYVILEYLTSEWKTGLHEGWQPTETLLTQSSYKYYYQKTVVRPFEKLFGYNKELFDAVSFSFGGKKEKLGGIAYSFQFLPKVKTLIQLWVGSNVEMTKPRINTSINTTALHFLKEVPLLYVFEILIGFMEKEAKKKGRS